MYPHRELIALAGRKAARQSAIKRERARCSALAVRLTRPLAELDRMLGWCRRLLPVFSLAAGTLGILTKDRHTLRHRILRSLLRWGPRLLSPGRRSGREKTGLTTAG